MDRTTRIRNLKVAALLLALSMALYAAFNLDPTNPPDPPVTMAAYGLQSNDLSNGGTRAYRPWFENGAWQGDVIEYFISATGVRSTDAQIGSGSVDNPPVAGSSGVCDHGGNPPGCWMARATFAAKESSVSNYWQEGTNGRTIITYADSDDDGTGDTQDVFTWDNLSPIQRLALDASTTTTGAYDSEILDFLRGDRSNEKGSLGGTLRPRFNLLGDIINSRPVYVGAPTENYTIEGFIDYKNTYSTRDGRIAVGANDGMLHVFDEDDGSEVYAYIPSMLIVDPDDPLGADTPADPSDDGIPDPSKLRKLANAPYHHTYYVDGNLTAVSAQINTVWKTVLAGGLGAGGKGLFVLDMTDADPDPGTDTVILYEKTGDDFGYIYGQPSIFRLEDDNWYVVTGNGFGSNNNSAKLLLINLNNGAVTAIPTTGSGTGLAPVALVDSNRDARADFAYGGDDAGDMWKFNLSDLSNPVVTRIYDGSPTQPITVLPEVGVSPYGGYMVLFGTGSIISRNDVNALDPQAIYGIWDNYPGNPADTPVTQVLTKVPQYDFGGNVETIRYVSTYTEPDYICDAGDGSECDIGWKVTLPCSGERVVGPPILRTGRVSVMTTNPNGTETETASLCTTPALDLSSSWLMSLFYLTGGDNDEVVMNLNGDSALDSGDQVDIDNSAAEDFRIPVGLWMGDGNIAQPALARIGPEVDVMYINGLRLLPLNRSDTLLSGHIDVDTDSPIGGSTAPNSVSKQSEGYNVTTNDGLGRAVDGHFHNYDTINGVHHVDFFELEPQRGQGNLAAVVQEKPGGGCPAGTIEETKEIGGEPFTGCVDIVEGELNRALDTWGNPGLDPTDPDYPPTLASEVDESAGVPLDPDQPFIVTLANADLSTAGWLQIGCRVWTVEEYENMITGQLEDYINNSTPIVPNALDDCPAGGCPESPHTTPVDNSLVFTLNSIAAGGYYSGGSTVADADTGTDVNGDTVCMSIGEDDPNGLSHRPTLRIGFNTRSILDAGIHGTRAQCVLGLHDYHDPVDYADHNVLCYAENALNPLVPVPAACNGLTQPTSGYIKNPAGNWHITESMEGTNNKFRWRNGALTLQLLKVSDADQSVAEFALQAPGFLPQSGKRGRFGGTYAEAFTGTTVNAGDIYPDSFVAGDSGLLYESVIYWHYSDLADELRRGDPASIPCYGDSSYGSALKQELGGLTSGEYDNCNDNALCAHGLDDQGLIQQLAALLDALQDARNDGDQNAINQALLELGKLLLENPDLQKYYDYRDYAPGHIPEQQLLDIDKGLVSGGDGGSSDSDGTPADIDDLTGGSDPNNPTSTLPLKGPNFVVGRRTWIDIRQ